MPTLAVIPWFLQPSLGLGLFTIQSFGVITAIGILVGVQLATRAAIKDGLEGRVIQDFAVVGVAAGIVGAHLVHLGFYHQEELREPLRILMFWEGLSSMGGAPRRHRRRRDLVPAARRPFSAILGCLRARHGAWLGHRTPWLLLGPRSPGRSK